MDILTQMALGGAVSSQILKSENPRRAIFLGAIIAAIPDLDMFLMFNVSDYEELILHRSFSHAVLPFLLLSFLIIFFNRYLPIVKNTSNFRLFICIFLVLLSHAFLDCLTTWGTQLFWPLDTRIATQSIYVIDLIYSFSLGSGLALLFVFQNKNWAFKTNRWTLLLSCTYLAMLLAYQEYFKVLIREEARFDEALRVATQPVLFEPFKYRAVIEHPDTFYVSHSAISVFQTDELDYYTIPKNKYYFIEISELIDLYPLFNLSRGYLSITKKDSNYYEINDLRYGPQNCRSENYNSIFSYYIRVENDSVIFSQNMRTSKRLEKMMRKVFL
ncbi:metal-dependent hydrolase [Hyphobacterium sp. CCMP332]|nr:metal-dependent hydrolase [Hyphobacterium sp. CCMP332]